MHVTGLALVPPTTAHHHPKVTPELLASVLARYSRSNDGIKAILEKVDLENPDASIDRILRFVDYGHASIAGLTGGLAVTLDNVSMWLGLKLFEIAQMADGQESSTRYITLDSTNLPEADSIGLPDDLHARWKRVMGKAFLAYQQEEHRLKTYAERNPSCLRLPGNVSPAVEKRLRLNYALDRCRYFLPVATRTNVALVMTARMWAHTIQQLASLPQIEAREAADALRHCLSDFSPRLLRHSHADASCQAQAQEELARSCALGLDRISPWQLRDEVWVKVEESAPPFLDETQGVADALRHRSNRYGMCGRRIRRMRVSFAWNNLAVAELRDLNRHRTGFRHTPLIQAGFYLPSEINRALWQEFIDEQTELTKELLRRGSPAYVYSLLLGSQTPFEHSTMADKFIYEAELRTGMGAHFRYAEHLSAALTEFFDQVPGARQWVEEGTAEPE